MAGSGAIRAGRAFVELFADSNPLQRDLKRGVALLRRYAATARSIGQSLVRSGVKVATPFAVATTIYAGFADQMAEVRAITQATASDFARLTQQAKQLGRTTSFTARQVAAGQAELGRAGFDPTEITASTAAVLNLARGTRTELTQAAQIGADSLRAFRLEASQMPTVADVLTATVNSSSQTLVDLFEALKTVGPAAADAGATISDTAAAIGVLANNGIKGTLAGTALRRAYLNLASPALQKKIKNLTGVSAVDADGNLRPLAGVITEIGRATANLPNARRLDIFSQIFGDRAVVAASSFASSAASFEDLQLTLNNAAGTAARTARMMDDTLGGSFRRLMSAAEGVAIAVGESLSPVVSSLADVATHVAGQLTSLIQKNRGLVVGLALTSAAAIVAGSALVAIGGSLSMAAFALSGIRKTAVAGLGILPGLLGAVRSPARLATAALLGIATAAGLSSTTIAAPTVQSSEIDEITQSITQQVVSADVPVVENQQQIIGQTVIEAKTSTVADQTHTVLQSLDAADVPIPDDITQVITQHVLAANVPEVAEQTQSVAQDVTPAEPVAVTADTVATSVPVDVEQPDTVVASVMPAQLPTVETQTQLLTQQAIPADLPTPDNQMQVIDQKLSTADVPPLDDQEQVVAQSVHPAELPTPDDATQAIEQQIVAAEPPAVVDQTQSIVMDQQPSETASTNEAVVTVIAAPLDPVTAATMTAVVPVITAAVPTVTADVTPPPPVERSVTDSVQMVNQNVEASDVPIPDDQTQTVTRLVDMAVGEPPAIDAETAPTAIPVETADVPVVTAQTETAVLDVIEPSPVSVTTSELQPVQVETVPASVPVETETPEATSVTTVGATVPVDTEQPEAEHAAVGVTVSDDIPQQLSQVANAATAAATQLAPMMSGFAGLRIAQGALHGVVGVFKRIPRVVTATSSSLAANSAAARRWGTQVGAATRFAGRVLSSSLATADAPLRLMTASTATLSSALLKTGAIVSGNVVSAFEAMAAAVLRSGNALGGAGRLINSAGNSAVLASSTLARAASRTSAALLLMGSVTRRVTIDWLALGRALAAFTVGRVVAGLKTVTQTLGGLTIAASRSVRGMVAAAASIRLAHVVSALSGGLSLAAVGFRKLSLAALVASINVGKAAKAIRSTLALQKVGAVARSAAIAISGVTASLFTLATSPAVLFAALAGGIASTTIAATGGMASMRDGLRTLAGDTGQVFRDLASQAGIAWESVRSVADRAIGAIVQRINAGDMEGAFRIGMAGIRLAWAETVASFAPTWAPVKVALANGWRDTTKLFSELFGGTMGDLKSVFGSFTEWFNSSDGAGSISITTADVVASIAKMWATGWSAIEQTFDDVRGGVLDAWDGMLQMIATPWNATIGRIIETWQRLKGLFDGRAQYEIEADIKRITADTAVDSNEAGQRINQRALESRNRKREREAGLSDQLASIEAERERRREEEQRQVADETDTAEADVQTHEVGFQLALTDSALTDAEAEVNRLQTQLSELKAQAQIGLDVDTSKVEGELAEARAELDRLRHQREQLRAEAGDPVAVAAQAETPAQAAVSGRDFWDSFPLLRQQQQTAAERRRESRIAGHEIAEAYRTRKPFQRDEQGRLVDPESGRAVDDIMAEDRAVTVKTQASRLEGARSGLDRVQGRLSGSVGTFSSRAAGQMGTTSVMNRVAKAVESSAKANAATAANTAVMSEKMGEMASGVEAE